MSASLAVQKAIRARLVGSVTVTSQVPAVHIVDSHGSPAPDPAIILGEDQEVEGERLARDTVLVFSTLHIWKKEPSLAGVKAIAASIRSAVAGLRGAVTDGFHIGDSYVSSSRFLRDPDGVTSHGVVTVETLVSGVS
jgi:hypothetical protein